MAHFFRFFVLLSFLPVIANATAMSEGRSRCLGMESTVQSYQGWKGDYVRFRNQLSNLSSEDQFAVANLGARKIVGLIEKIRQSAEFKSEDAALNSARRLFNDLDTNNITHESALPVLLSGLERLDEKMHYVVEQAEIKYSCELYQRPVILNQQDAVVPVQR